MSHGKGVYTKIPLAVDASGMPLRAYIISYKVLQLIYFSYRETWNEVTLEKSEWINK